MERKTKASPEQLRARLGLRASSAATPHENTYRSEKRPGKNNRRKHNAKAIKEQELTA